MMKNADNSFPRSPALLLASLLVTIPLAAGVMRTPAEIHGRLTEDVKVTSSNKGSQLSIIKGGATIARGRKMHLSAGVHVEAMPVDKGNLSAVLGVDGILSCKGKSNAAVLIRGYAGQLVLMVGGDGRLEASDTIFRDMKIIVNGGELKLENCLLDNCAIEYVAGKSPKTVILKNCTIKRNITDPALNIGRVEKGPAVRLENVKITGNKLGGLEVSGRFAFDSERPEIFFKECDINNNDTFDVKLEDSKNIVIKDVFFGETDPTKLQAKLVRVPKDDRKGRIIILNPAESSRAGGAPDLANPNLKKKPEGLPPYVTCSWAEAEKAGGGGETPSGQEPIQIDDGNLDL